MKKIFKGRVIAAGEKILTAVVSKNGVNTLATFQKSALANAKEVLGADQNNPDIFEKNLTGKALCLPITIGSTTGGLVIQTIISMNIHPHAFLFSEHIDSLSASGIILAKVYENSDIIAIDGLGKDFLATVKTDDKIKINLDGTVEIIS